MKESSIIHHDSMSIVSEMSDELAGKFLKNLIILMKHGKIETTDFSLKMALIPFENQFKRDEKKYEKICERNRKNGELGGRKKDNPVGPKEPSGVQWGPKNPDAPDNDSDSDSDNDSDNKKKTFLSDSVECRLSNLLLSKIKERNHEHKQPDIQKWAKSIDYMLRIDKRDPQKIANVINWCQTDTFWADNILSTSKLRKQYDALVLKMSNRSLSKNGKQEQPGPRYNTAEETKKMLEQIHG